jgi:hypothetical protein
MSPKLGGRVGSTAKEVFRRHDTTVIRLRGFCLSFALLTAMASDVVAVVAPRVGDESPATKRKKQAEICVGLAPCRSRAEFKANAKIVQFPASCGGTFAPQKVEVGETFSDFFVLNH